MYIGQAGQLVKRDNNMFNSLKILRTEQEYKDALKGRLKYFMRKKAHLKAMNRISYCLL